MDRSAILDSVSRITSEMDEEALGERYSEEFREFVKSHSRKAIFDMILDWIELLQSRLHLQDMKILDVGCGFGVHSIVFAHYGNEVTGIDVFRPRVDVGQRVAGLFGEQKVLVKEGNSAKVDCDDGTFDVVYCNEFVSHVGDLETSLKELNRVLKDGGQILITDCDRKNLASLRLRYITLNKMYEASFRKEREEIIRALSEELNLGIGGATVARLARKTKGWTERELGEMVDSYSQGERGMRALLSIHKPKFPFRNPRSGMYEERLFSPSEVEEVLLRTGYSQAHRVPLSNLPSSLAGKLYFYLKKLKGDLDIKYLVVGTK